MNISWWPLSYNRKWFRFDLLAGLITSAVVIPKAMAFATIAGLPVEVGIYTALIPMIIYAILGTSKQLSVSCTTTIAILTAAEIAAIAPNGTTSELITISITLAFLVGIFLIIAAILRLGFLANFISAPILTGFKAGIAVVIIIDQIPKLLGIQSGSGNFLQKVTSIIHNIPTTSITTLMLAVVTLLIIFKCKIFFPRIPSLLLAIIAGICAVMIFSVQEHGIKLVGTISPGLPSFSMLKLSLIEKLWPGALGIAVMSFTETIAAGKAFLAHDDPPPNANHELFALGAANLVGSFFQTMPAGGGTTQTVVNYQSGARSQASELVTAGLTIIILFFLTSLISKIPQATLAAIVIATSITLLKPLEFSAILQIRKTEFFWALIAFFGVIIFGVLYGILIAITISIMTLIYQANHPPLYILGRKKGTKDVFQPLRNHPNVELFPGLLILRTEGMMTFASTPHLADKFNELITKYNPKVLLLELSAVPNIEYTALLMLIDAEEKLQQHGIELQLTALNPQALEVIRHSKLGKKLEKNRMFFTLEQAVNTWLRPSI